MGRGGEVHGGGIMFSTSFCSILLREVESIAAVEVHRLLEVCKSWARKFFEGGGGVMCGRMAMERGRVQESLASCAKYTICYTSTRFCAI